MDLELAFKQYPQIMHIQKEEILVYKIKLDPNLGGSELVDYRLINQFLSKKFEFIIQMKEIINENVSLMLFAMEKLKLITEYNSKLRMIDFVTNIREILRWIIYLYGLNENFLSFDFNFCFFDPQFTNDLKLKIIHIRKY